MKTIIFIAGLLSFLIAPIATKAIEAVRGEPRPGVWIMSIEVCKDFPPEVQDAVKRGIVFLTQQCKWFAIGTDNLMGVYENELSIWPTYQECMDADIVDVQEGFTVRKRFCQSMKELT